MAYYRGIKYNPADLPKDNNKTFDGIYRGAPFRQTVSEKSDQKRHMVYRGVKRTD